MIHNVAFADTLSWMPRKKIPQSEKKVAVGARVDPELRDWLEDVAASDDRTVSYMVEKALLLMREHLGSRREQPEEKKPRR
jgi:hypothetical protein